jgi:hypothetical protein
MRPMNIFVVDEKFERPVHVEIPDGLSSISAKECGKCHVEEYAEWSSSMHSMAWTDPYYQIDYIFEGSQQICLNCHIPLENQQEHLVTEFRDRDKFKPLLEPNPDYDKSLRSEGVTCAVCHVKNGKIVGPYGNFNAPHSVMADPSMSSGIKACKKCHVVSGDKWDTFFKFPPCGTVAEIDGKGHEPDCVGCHMTELHESTIKGKMRKSHFFKGGHDPETVRKALKVKYEKEIVKEKGGFNFTLTNVGAEHYIPTGIPDRHLTLEFRLLDANGELIKKKIYKMKRYVLWRPFIIDIKDTRLPYAEPRRYTFEFSRKRDYPPSTLEVTVRYHLLDEKIRKRIGYENKEPIAYEVYKRIT